jgi:hypothetical protein
MNENWESTTKATQIMREVLVIPKPGLGMLALFLGGLLGAGVIFIVDIPTTRTATGRSHCVAIRPRLPSI